MTEYTPTTEEIREYVEVGGELRQWIPPTPEKDEARVAAFDRWLAAHDKALIAERDAALAVIEHANSWAINSWGYTEKLQIVEICRALARTPTEALAAHDAEVAAKALRKFADDLTGYTLNCSSPLTVLHQIVGLLNRNADLATEGATN